MILVHFRLDVISQARFIINDVVRYVRIHVLNPDMKIEKSENQTGERIG